MNRMRESHHAVSAGEAGPVGAAIGLLRFSTRIALALGVISLWTAASGRADVVHMDDVVINKSGAEPGLCVGENCAIDGSEPFAESIRIRDDEPTMKFIDPFWGTFVVRLSGNGNFQIYNEATTEFPFAVLQEATTNQLVAAETGVGIGTAVPAQELHIIDEGSLFGPAIRFEDNDGQIWELEADDLSFTAFDVTNDNRPLQVEAGAPNAAVFVESSGHVGLGTTSPSATLQVAGDAIVDGNFSTASSRDIKHAFTPVEPRDVLERLLDLPITRWSYRTDSPAIRHMGPVAEEFGAAFALGRDNQHVSPVDLSGVAFAAIQGLHEIVSERDAEIEELRDSRDELASRLEALERLVADREAANGTGK